MKKNIFLLVVLLLNLSGIELIAKGSSKKDDKTPLQEQTGKKQISGQTLREEKRKDNTHELGGTELIKTSEKVREKLKICTQLTEEIQQLTKFISKETVKENNDSSVIGKTHEQIINKLSQINKEGFLLIENIGQAEKEEIRDQLKTINEAENKTKSISENISLDLNNKTINSEKLLKKYAELEKEVNKIERQFRAIEWILEQK